MSLHDSVKSLPIHSFSDGDPSHRPKDGWALVSPAHPYLEKLAEAWMKQRHLRPEPNVRYYLDRLPDGYAL